MSVNLRNDELISMLKPEFAEHNHIHIEGNMTSDIVQANFTVPLFYTTIYPNITIPAAITVTIIGELQVPV